MERKPRQKKEVLLPTSLMEDIECDELDKELQLIQINENNILKKKINDKLKNKVFIDSKLKLKNHFYKANSQAKVQYLYIILFFAFNYLIIVNEDMKDTNTILTNNLSIFNNNINISNEENLNGLHFDNINENINFNSINSDKNDFLQNEQENDYLKFKLNCNYINDIIDNIRRINQDYIDIGLNEDLENFLKSYFIIKFKWDQETVKKEL